MQVVPIETKLCHTIHTSTCPLHLSTVFPCTVFLPVSLCEKSWTIFAIASSRALFSISVAFFLVSGKHEWFCPRNSLPENFFQLDEKNVRF